MRKKFICGMFFLLCGIYTIISTPAIANHQQGPQMLCGERTSLLETFKKDFNEIPEPTYKIIKDKDGFISFDFD